MPALFRRCLLLAFLGVAPVALPARAAPAPAAFEAAPDDLLAQARELLDARRQAIAEGADPTPVEYLLDRFELHLDEQGRARTVYHQVFVVAERDAVDSWGQVSAGWAPWLEERPQLQARVIDPSGRIYALHEDEIAEVGASEEGTLMYSENRSLRAPLPGVRKGAVVEQQLVLQEHRTMVQGSALARRFLGNAVPTAQSEILVSYPSSANVSTRVVGLDTRPKKQTRDGRTELRWELGALPAWDKPESYTGLDQGLPPYLDIATKTSWAALAQAYQAMVADRFTPEGIEDLVAEAQAIQGDRLARISAITALVTQRIRYTGLEFGGSAIVPYAPTDTVRRGYGDCKDQSTLLAVLLQQAGIPARLALLRSGLGDDVAPDLPGMDRFNHAIVYLPEDDLWIDPTDGEMPVGLVPPSVRWRHALVIDPSTRDLVRIPDYRSEDHVYTEVRTLTLRPAQPALWQETVHSTGWFASQDGYEYGQASPQDLGRHLGEYASNEYGSDEIEHSWSQDIGGDGHFELSLGGESPWYELWGSGTALALSTGQVLDRLPSPLLDSPEADPRQHDVSGAPFQASLSLVVKAPPGFGPETVPPDAERNYGDASISIQHDWQPDQHQLTATLHINCGDCRFTPDETQQLRTDLADLSWAAPDLRIVDLNRLAFDHGQVAEALAGWQDLATTHPDEPLYAAQHAAALLDLGLGQAARDELEALVERFPEHAYAWFDLGFARLADDDGLQLTGHIERQAAVQAFDRVLELDPELVDAHYNAALALVHREPGFIEALDEEALARHLDAWIDANGEQTAAQDPFIVECLLRLGQTTRVRRMVADSSPTLETMAHAVAAAAMDGGTEAAEAELRGFSLGTKQQAEVAQQAFLDLYTLRNYSAAGGLLTDLSSYMHNPAQASSLGYRLQSLKRHEELLTDQAIPEHVALRAFRGVLDPAWQPGSAPPGTSAENHDPPTYWRAFKDGFVRAAIDMALPDALSVDAILLEPFTRSVAQTPAVRLGIGEQGQQAVYVVQERKDWRLLTFGDDVATQGVLALQALERGRTHEALQWGEWMRIDLQGAAGRVSPQLAALAEDLWASQGLSDEQRVERLAEVAATRAVDGAAILETYEHSGTELTEELNLQLGLSFLHQLWGDLNRSSPRRIVPEALGHLQVDALRPVVDIIEFFPDQPAQAEAVMSDALDEVGDDLFLHVLLYESRMLQGKAREAALALDPVLAQDDSGWLLHHQAWAFLVAGDLPRATAAARTALRRGQTGSRALHTAALALALSGAPDEALPILRQAHRVHDSKATDPRWWLVHGAIAEAWGLTEHARHAYQRVPAPEDGGSPDDWTVARARLDALTL